MVFKGAYRVVQDTDKALAVMHSTAIWMVETGKHDEFMKPEDMNRKSMLKHAEANEFYVVLVDGRPAASAILQDSERNQSWASVDKGKHVPALYVHWVCVAPEFQGKGLTRVLIDFAVSQARARGLPILRLDTNAREPKLMKVYQDLDFNLVHIEPEGDRQTAFFQKAVAKL